MNHGFGDASTLMFPVDAKLFFRHNTEPGLFKSRDCRNGEDESGKGA